MVLKKKFIYLFCQRIKLSSVPFTGAVIVVIVIVVVVVVVVVEGAVAEVVNLIPLGLTYSLLFVVVCDVEFGTSCPSSTVVDDSFVSIILGIVSSNEGTIIGKFASDDEFSVVDSASLFVGSVFVGGMVCVALSIAVGRSLSSICDD
jgi:hypothetical protein